MYIPKKLMIVFAAEINKLNGTNFRPSERVTGLGGEMELSKADSVYGK